MGAAARRCVVLVYSGHPPARCSSSSAAFIAADNEGAVNSFGWFARAITYRQSIRAMCKTTNSRSRSHTMHQNSPSSMTASKLEWGVHSARMRSSSRSPCWVQGPRRGIIDDDNGTLTALVTSAERFCGSSTSGMSLFLIPLKNSCGEKAKVTAFH